MGFFKRLYVTYELALQQSDNGYYDHPLLPIAHTNQTAHIKIVIDIQGNFVRAEVLDKMQIALPATEKSASRSSGLAPHPLADKILYIAADYENFGGRKKPGFELYQKQLARWCNSQYQHPKVKAVMEYINKRSVISDLIDEKVCCIDSKGTLLTQWKKNINDEETQPELLRVLPKEKGEFDQGSALVCWEVINDNDFPTETWKNPDIAASWANFISSNNSETKLCYVSGSTLPFACNHPSKIRHPGDKAKLISSNDNAGFTFKGRALSSDEVASVSSVVTQKAHNTLAWLVANQPKGRTEDQHLVCWSSGLNPVPQPLGEIIDLDDDDDAVDTKHVVNAHSPEFDHTLDLGMQFASNLHFKMKGYFSQENALKFDDTIAIMVVDSATPGRMAVSYYRELFAKDYIEKLEKWQLEFAWPQKLSKQAAERNKSFVNNIFAPSPYSILQAAYGDVIKSNKALKKKINERLLPCIVEDAQFPKDILQRALSRASMPLAVEQWEWERNLAVACAVYKGFHMRTHKLELKKDYKMALDIDYNGRDYLFGRLLAVADNIENYALYKTGVTRPTTALRLMQRFSQQPAATWPNIYNALNPYIRQLTSSAGGFINTRLNDIDEISNKFEIQDYNSNATLTGEYLLGFHCQRRNYREKSNSQEASADAKKSFETI